MLSTEAHQSGASAPFYVLNTRWARSSGDTSTLYLFYASAYLWAYGKLQLVTNNFTMDLLHIFDEEVCATVLNLLPSCDVQTAMTIAPDATPAQIPEGESSNITHFCSRAPWRRGKGRR